MDFIAVWLSAFPYLFLPLVLLWLFSVIIKNASIIDPFWSIGFLILSFHYYSVTESVGLRSEIVFVLIVLWAIRLSGYLLVRNWGKGEDYRYQKFRKNYGVKRYWWFSFFQVFLLQGILCWIISLPLLAVFYYTIDTGLIWLDYIALALFVIGFIFESLGDLQLWLFKSNSDNKGKVLRHGLWKYSRHPNYFGEAVIWWGIGLFCLATNTYLPLVGVIVMTYLLLKVSGVSLLERSLSKTKSGYGNYIETTSSFIPWFPKKS